MNIKDIHENHRPKNTKELEGILENVYRCKIVYKDLPEFTKRHITFAEDIHQTWFLMKFGN